MFALGVTLKIVQIACEICVGIGVAMCEIDCIMIMLKLYAKGEGVVVSRILPLHRILIIANIRATSVPTSTASLGFSIGVCYWSHTVVIEGVWFHQIYNVETVGLSSASIRNAEVVPLRISSSVIVWFKYQIILKLINLDGSSKIS